jgi:hypothetical protein
VQAACSVAILLVALLATCVQTVAASDPSSTQAGADSVGSFEIAGGAIEIARMSMPRAVSQPQLSLWIHTAARAVSTYYGRFPVKRVTLNLSVTAKRHQIHGRTYDGRQINVEFGPDVNAADLDDDWILTHEMFHLAFPDLGDDHNWMNEGLSTYLEPIARARIGTLKPERVWHDMVEGMPQGLPEAGDRGLDRTHTWGRTYWGGCLFWLMADVQIREQTNERRSLDDALRAILDAGGDGSVTWPIPRVIETGDRATGVHVLKDLYDEMALKPAQVDLDSFWKKLGVKNVGATAVFDDAAPLASIRKAITAKITSNINK